MNHPELMTGYVSANDPMPEVPPISSPKSKVQYFFDADYLLWKGFAEGFEYCGGSETIRYVFSKVRQDAQDFSIPLPWTSNYRLKAGVLLPKQKRDIQVDFARFHSRSSRKEEAYSLPDSPILPTDWGPNLSRTWALGSFNNIAESIISTGFIKGQLDLKYLCFDLEFGKKIWDVRHFAVRLQAGVRAVSIRERLLIEAANNTDTGNTYSYDASVSNMEIRQKFSGGGPRIGADFNVMFLRYFTWYNTVAACLAVGALDLEQDEQFNPPDGAPFPSAPVPAKSRIHLHTVKPNFQGAIGLQYKSASKERQFLLKVGYEIDYWLNHNQMRRFTATKDVPVSYVKEDGDVAFHGLVVEGGLVF